MFNVAKALLFSSFILFTAEFCFADAEQDALDSVASQMTVDDAPAGRSSTTTEFGIGLFNFDFQEDVAAPKKSSELGGNLGFHFGINSDFARGYFARFLLDFSQGTTRYDGVFQTTTKNLWADAQTQFGFSLLKDESIARLRIYGGLGYHLWIRDSSSHSSGYREDYEWAYLPIGVRLETAGGKEYEFGIDFSIRPTIAGKLNAHLSKFNIQDAQALLGEVFSSKLEFPITVRSRSSNTVVFTPWLEVISIKQSGRIPFFDSSDSYLGTAVEPKSLTIQYGLNVNLRFE